jgi:hypothetical protein
MNSTTTIHFNFRAFPASAARRRVGLESRPTWHHWKAVDIMRYGIPGAIQPGAIQPGALTYYQARRLAIATRMLAHRDHVHPHTVASAILDAAPSLRTADLRAAVRAIGWQQTEHGPVYAHPRCVAPALPYDTTD